MSTICLVSPVHLWVNPRLVKEADTLHAAGYDVRIGYRADSAWGRARDDELLRTRSWRSTPFDVSRTSGRRWFSAAALQRAAQLLVRRGITSPRIDAEAYCRGYGPMTQWATRQRADLYIGHTHAVLPVVARAAEAGGAAFAFDCEDLLADEVADGLQAPWRRALILRHERRYLPRASYVSATSEPMRAHLAATYALPRVHVWHNCFPSADQRDAVPPADAPPAPPIRLAWISATIGPNRGLEDVLAALPSLGAGFQLHVHGNLPPEQQSWWMTATGSLGAGVRHHPLLPAHEIIPALSRYDIGLSLDPPESLNRDLTISNKVFHYLQAGLAVVATDTRGHRSVLGGDPPLGVLYPPRDSGALATALRTLGRDELRLALRQRAWAAGRTTYNWDIQKQWLLNAVSEALPR